jgi:signal transduction histidine kinase
VLSYPGLLESSPYTSSDVSTYFHVIARLVIIVALLAAAFLPFRRPAKVSDSILIIVGAVVFTLLVFYVVIFQTDSLPSIYSENGRLTSYGRGFKYTSVFLFGLGILVYSCFGRVRGQSTHFYIPAALVAGVFGELSFSLYSLASNLVNLMAYCFEFTSFLILFLALLKESVAMPFEWLTLTWRMHEKDQGRLDLKIKEIEEARHRSQAHLDFFAHDVSNIISPIASYAEMLLAGDNLTSQQRKYVDTILRQAQRGGSFVANLRRLANAEAVSPGAFVGIDLGRVLLGMEEVVRSTYPTKTISTTLALPVDTQAIAPGGEHIEDVLYEILKNAVEDVPEGPVRLSITLRQVRNEHGKRYWQVCITQFDHKFPPETLAEARVIYDPRRGIGRGIASSYPFSSSIVNHFGGRLWIENLPETDKTQNSRVTIELPAADTMMGLLRGDQT